jgi:hypothetical protein
MARTGWINEITGERLSSEQLRIVTRSAHRLYKANSHIFEDEREALGALGVVPAIELTGTARRRSHDHRSAA